MEVFALELYSRVILCIVYVLSLLLMLFDFLAGPFRFISLLFYIMTNASLLFRLFGANTWTIVIHILIFIFLTGNLYWVHPISRYRIYTALIIAYAIQFFMGLVLMIFFPGKKVYQRGCRAGVHAMLGLLTIILYFWVTAFITSTKNLQSIFEMIYMFLVLFLLLGPFMSSKQRSKLAEIYWESMEKELA